MLPGKKYTPEDILKILRRRFWVLVVPLAVIAAGTAAVARKLPDTYMSSTLVQVVPQQVPESYVRSTITQTLEERLAGIQAQILSRTRLERIIQEFKLYEKERETWIMQDVVEAMRKDIRVSPAKGDMFQVTYTGRDPRVVQRVTEKLGSLFVDESLKDRELLAQNTDQFLEAAVEDARRQLIDSENKVKLYQQQHAGELPTQLSANQDALANAQQAIREIATSLDRDADRRLVIERQLGELEAMADLTAPSGDPVTMGPDSVPAGGTASQRLEAARKALANARTRYTDDNPNVRQLMGIVADLEKKAEAEALEAPVSTGTRMSAAEAQRRKRLEDARTELQQLDRQMAIKQAEQKRLRTLAAEYQRRIDAAPNRESEMFDLTRDYETLKASYASLRGKKEESNLAAKLEGRNAGEQFRVIDAARVSEKPVSPDRHQINLIGIMAGLAVGVGLVGLLEYRDQSFKTDEEIAALLTLPVLAVVPLMQSDTERKASSRRRLILGVGLGGTVLGCLALLVYTFVR